MDVSSVIDQLIGKDISFPALKLVLDNKVDLKCSTELPKITPSHYLRENGLTTDQRLALLCKQQRRMSCWRPGNDVVVEPAIIVFQNYKSGETHQVPINIRNTSKMSQKVVILMDENSIFKLDECSQRVAKFPCGMAITATINFYPDDDRDYYHKLVIHTNTSRFAIPIVCIGGRGLLSAPDSIVYEAAPVRFMSTRTIPLYNNGSKPARFTLATTGPFCVSPEQGLVPPKDSFSMNVSFYSESLGEHDGYLVIKYENGEEVYICLRANAVNLNVTLEPSEIDFEDIYLGIPSKLVCSLTNHSDYVLDFKWKKDPHTIPDNRKSKLEGTSSSGGSSSTKRSVGDTLDRVIDLLENCGDGNDDCLGVARGLEDFINLKNPEQLFSDECFMIEPTSGQLQPHSSMDIYVIFTPLHAAVRSITSYLDISGNLERIPLHLTGRGLGPKFRFGYEILDLGVVFFGGAHTYEIPVVNVGSIPGKVIFEKVMGLSSNPSLNLKVEPRKLELDPDEHGAFYVSFHCAAKLGSFEDEMKFILPRTKEQIYVTVRGSIAYPLLHFHENELDFEDVPYGFPQEKQITVINDSLNAVDVCLAVEDDGQDLPIDFNMILQSFSDDTFQFPENPAEFIIKPSTLTLTPRASEKISISCCAHQLGPIKKALICYVASKEFEPIDAVAELTLTANCLVPKLINGSPNLSVSNCYVQFPCNVEVFVTNTWEIPACYSLVPQKMKSVKVISEDFVGIAAANTTTAIPLKIISSISGSVIAFIDVFAVGVEPKMFTFAVKMDVLPSQIQSYPKMIDFGNIAVLQYSTASSEIKNESPLTVTCTAEIINGGKRGEEWQMITIPETLGPYSTNKIEAGVTLLEPGPHDAKLHIKLIESSTYLDVGLLAYGVGSSVEITPALENQSTIDFGILFTKAERRFQYEIKNVGLLPKILDWRHAKDPPPIDPNAKKEKSKRADSNSKKKEPPPDFHLRKMIFTIFPEKVLLQPQGTATVQFTSSSKRAIVAEDSVQLWTYAPVTLQNSSKGTKESKKDKDNFATQPSLAREVILKAIYERPCLVFSRKFLSFKIDATPSLEEFEQRETITVENRGAQTVTASFKTSHPFYVEHEKSYQGSLTEWVREFKSGEILKLTLVFNIQSVTKEESKMIFESEMEVVYNNLQASRESVPLRGEVSFPTLKIEKTQINFGTIVNGTEAVEDLSVVNEGPHPLTFRWYILPETTMVVRGGRQAQLDQGFLEVSPSTQESEIMFKDLPVPQTTAISRSTDSAPMVLYPRDLYGRTTSSESLDNYAESVQVERVRMQRDRLMGMLGLQDPESEYEDEYNYLTHHIPEPPSDREIFVNEIIDIIPLAGTIPAGSAQTFSVVFYGHNDMNFQTTAFCNIDGGTGVSILIRGISSPRPASLIKPPVKIPVTSSSKSSLDAAQKKKKSKDASEAEAKKKKSSSISKSKTKPASKPKKKHVRIQNPNKKGKDKQKPPCDPNEPGDSRISPDTLQLLGSCVPAVCNDPEVLFPKIVDFKKHDQIYNRVYIREEDCFDFGPTIVPVPAKKVDGASKTDVTPPNPRVKHKENVSKFTVRNISAMPALCTLRLVHGRKKYFEFSPEQFIVEPGGHQIVTLWAFPRLPEVVIEDHLVFCIKDNPDPIFFRIRVVGTTPKVYMDQNFLDFGKHLLNTRSTAHVTVTNTGVIPVVWQLSKHTRLPEYLYVEKTRGIIKPAEAAQIRFLFKSNSPVVLTDEFLDIEFLDTQKILGIIDVFKVALIGEAYDVAVDIMSEKTDFTLVDFGLLPVGYPVVQNLIVTNIGTYDILFKFLIDGDRLSHKNKHFAKILKDYMLVFPKEDALEPSQASLVQIVFEPPKTMHFINEPIIVIQIVDLIMNIIVAELTVPVSVKSERQSISAEGPLV